MSKTQHTIQERVLEEIQEGKVKMRPKQYFVAHTALIFFTITFILLVSVYIASFAVFVLRNNGAWFIPAFGLEGAIDFFASVPWILVLFLAATVALLEIVMRRNTISYRKPLLITLGSMFLVVSAVGVFVGHTSFHKNLLTRAEKGSALPVMGPVYRELCARRVDNVHQGVIVSVQERGFCIHDAAGKLIAFIMSPATKLSQTKEVEEGDRVVVLSKTRENIAHARGIRKIADEREVVQMADATIREVSERCKLLVGNAAP